MPKLPDDTLTEKVKKWGGRTLILTMLVASASFMSCKDDPVDPGEPIDPEPKQVEVTAEGVSKTPLGTPIPNQEVTLDIGEESYATTTDADGEFVFNLNLSTTENRADAEIGTQPQDEIGGVAPWDSTYAINTAGTRAVNNVNVRPAYDSTFTFDSVVQLRDENGEPVRDAQVQLDVDGNTLTQGSTDPTGAVDLTRFYSSVDQNAFEGGQVRVQAEADGYASTDTLIDFSNPFNPELIKRSLADDENQLTVDLDGSLLTTYLSPMTDAELRVEVGGEAAQVTTGADGSWDYTTTLRTAEDSLDVLVEVSPQQGVARADTSFRIAADQDYVSTVPQTVPHTGEQLSRQNYVVLDEDGEPVQGTSITAQLQSPFDEVDLPETTTDTSGEATTEIPTSSFDDAAFETVQVQLQRDDYEAVTATEQYANPVSLQLIQPELGPDVYTQDIDLEFTVEGRAGEGGVVQVVNPATGEVVALGDLSGVTGSYTGNPDDRPDQYPVSITRNHVETDALQIPRDDISNAERDLDEEVFELYITTRNQDGEAEPNIPVTIAVDEEVQELETDANGEAVVSRGYYPADTYDATFTTTPNDLFSETSVNADIEQQNDVGISLEDRLVVASAQGTVTGDDGGDVQGAEVVYVEEDSGITGVSTTDASGSYNLTLSSVPKRFLGERDVTATASADTYVEEQRTVQLQQDMVQDFNLARILQEITGQTLQEGLTLPNADITVVNKDTGETLGSTTSNASGMFTFTDPSGDAYTAEVIADTPEHLSTTETIEVTGEGTFDAGTLDLNRTAYDVNTTATGRFGDVSGATVTITDGSDTYTSATGADGSTTTPVTTPQPSVTRTVEKPGYEDDTTTLTLNGERDQDDAATLQELVYSLSVDNNDEEGNPLSPTVTVTEDGNQIRSGTATDGSIIFSDITLQDGVYDGDTADVTAEQTGYDNATTSIIFDKNNPNQDVNLAQNIIEYTYDVTVTDQDGIPVSGASIVLEDGSDPSETGTTNTSGTATVSGTVKTGVEENETISLESNLEGYDTASTTVTADPNNRNQAIALQINEENPVETYTIIGATTQEGLPLGNAEITVLNQDTGQNLGVLTTDDAGNFTFADTTTTGISVQVTGDTPEHLSTTETIEVTGEGTFDAGTLDLNRTAYDVNTAVTGLSGGVEGAEITITDGTNTYSSTTDGSGNATTEITTPQPSVTRTVEKPGYEITTNTLTLNGERLQDDAATLQEILYAVTTNINDTEGDPVNADVVLTENGAEVRNGTATGGSITFSDITFEDGVYDGDTANVTAAQTGYDDATTSIVFDKNNPNQDVNLAQNIIEYAWDVNVTDENGNPLNGANVVLEDGSDPSETGTTNTSGSATVSGTVKTGVEENENIGLEATLNGYDTATTTVTADPGNRTKTATLQLTEQNSSYPITFTIDEVELSTWEAPGDLEELVVTAGPNTYTLDTSSGSATASIEVPGGTTEITLTQDDADYINTFVANNTWNEPLPDWSEEPDYQGNTTITIPVSALNQNGDSEYQVTVIPVESPDGYSTIGDVSPEVNESARWIGNNPDIKLCVVKEDTNGDNITDTEYQQIQDGAAAAVARTAAPVDTLNYDTGQECIENVATPRNNEDVSILRYGPKGNGRSFNGRFVENSQISAFSSTGAGSETMEGLNHYDDAGVIFFNSDGTLNDTAEFYSNIVYTIRSQSDIE
jgi:hypothetical protein